MKKEMKIAEINGRIGILQGRTKSNSNIINKLERKKRLLMK